MPTTRKIYKTFISLCPVAIETIIFAGPSLILHQFLAEKSYLTRLRYSRKTQVMWLASQSRWTLVLQTRRQSWSSHRVCSTCSACDLEVFVDSYLSLPVGYTLCRFGFFHLRLCSAVWSLTGWQQLIEATQCGWELS